MTNLYKAAKALVEKVRKEHPGEELYEPVVINLDKAVNEYEAVNNNQIDPWKAIRFAVEHIDDWFDKDQFLKDCQESDMDSIVVDWPEFVEWVNT